MRILNLFVPAISRRSLLPVFLWHPGDPLISRDPVPPEFPTKPALCKRPLCVYTRHDSIQRCLRCPSLQVPPAQGERGLAAYQRSGHRPSGEPAGCGCPSGAHQHSHLLQSWWGAMSAVPEPRGPGSDQALSACPAHSGVAPPLPGISHPQLARGGREADSRRQGAWAAAGPAEQTGGEGEGSDHRAQAEEEGYSHPAVPAHATNHQRPEGTAERLNAHCLGGIGYHLHFTYV